MNAQGPISVAVWRYDRTQALFDGRVKIEGRRTTFIDAPLEEIFSRAFEKAEFDVSELSFSNYLRLSVAGQCPYLGLPIFPSRSFRHGAFYIRADGPVQKPDDLIGRRVGVREYSMTAAMAARGALRDHFGIDTGRFHWVVGDVDVRERDIVPLPRLYKPLTIDVAPDGALLSDLLVSGQIDAILSYKPIKPFQKAQSQIRRLFENHVELEQAYFAKTGIFPIMHLMGLRRDHAAPGATLGSDVFNAFVEAQQIAMDDLRSEQALKITLPWIGEEVRRTTALMGQDYWPNGFAANETVIRQMIRWSFEDGLIPTLPEPETLFLAP